MRQRRRKILNEPAWYHAVSRIAFKQHLINDAGKEVLRNLIWNTAEFCGVSVLTYVILDNHFHVLVKVPKREELSDKELLKRCALHYRNDIMKYREFEIALSSSDQSEREKARKDLLRRMYDISEYMKEVKQRFSRWYNLNHQNSGTLWEGRFKSVVVEGTALALKTVAAYIDLNPVRAGIVEDPKDYRHCGYAEAVTHSIQAIDGIRGALCLGKDTTTKWILREYRNIIFGIGAQKKMGKGLCITHEQFKQEIVKKGGNLSLIEILRCKLRFITEGHIIGSSHFVKRHFGNNDLKNKKLRPTPLCISNELKVLETLRL